VSSPARSPVKSRSTPGVGFAEIHAPSSRLARLRSPNVGCDGRIVATAARPKLWCPAAQGSRDPPEGQDVRPAAKPQLLRLPQFPASTVPNFGVLNREFCASGIDASDR
jgi:hypothetical protein